MSKYIPVDPEKWAEMVKAQAEVKQLKEHIRYLEIELTTETARWERAMQEVERLRASSFVTAVPVEEYEKLKAEVGRLEKENEMYYRDSMSDEYDLNHQIRIINGLLGDKEKLQAEVERLRKAGDGLGWAVHRLKERFWDADEEANKAIHDWNAAKDGKPSE